jgi:hypothetical protein
MNQKNSYTNKELLKSANNLLMGPNTGKLPFPPMLMVDRISQKEDSGGKFNKGKT